MKVKKTDMQLHSVNAEMKNDHNWWSHSYIPIIDEIASVHQATAAPMVKRGIAYSSI